MEETLMRLIDDFSQRLDEGTLPERFTDWWIVEDDDRTFLEHPFDRKDNQHYDWLSWENSWVWPDFVQENNSVCGFGRIKTRTKKQQVWYDKWNKQFPEKLIGQLRDLFWRLKTIDSEIDELPHLISELKKVVEDKKDFISRMKNRIKPGMTTDQISSSFPSLEWNDDGELFLDWDCEGCSKT